MGAALGAATIAINRKETKLKQKHKAEGKPKDYKMYADEAVDPFADKPYDKYGRLKTKEGAATIARAQAEIRSRDKAEVVAPMVLRWVMLTVG